VEGKGAVEVGVVQVGEGVIASMVWIAEIVFSMHGSG
jgi:hypothetical protein